MQSFIRHEAFKFLISNRYILNELTRLFIATLIENFSQIINSKMMKFDEELKFPLRFKVSLVVTLIVLILMAPVGYLLAKYLQPKLTVTDNTRVAMPDGSIYGMAKLTLVDNDLNIFEPTLQYEMYITYPIQSASGRRMQGGVSTNYYLHSYDQETGINAKMSAQGNTSFYVNINQFTTFASKEAAQTSAPSNPKEGKSVSDKVFLEELNLIFTSALETSTGTKNVEVKFTNVTMANLKINPASRFMQFDVAAGQTVRSLVQLQARNLGFLSSILSVAGKIIPKVAGFFVNTVRKYGPLIGKVAGGIIGGVGGFFIGGPMGAFQGAMTGMKIGEAVGSAAQSLVNACIPQGTLRISCTPSSIGSVLNQFGGGSGMGGIAAGLSIFQNSASQFGSSMFGGVSNIMGAIPSKALSFFGLGSIFGS